MRVTITFDCENAAFGETPDEMAAEIVHILRKASDAAYTVTRPGEPESVRLRDSFGNTVGAMYVTGRHSTRDE